MAKGRKQKAFAIHNVTQKSINQCNEFLFWGPLAPHITPYTIVL